MKATHGSTVLLANLIVLLVILLPHIQYGAQAHLFSIPGSSIVFSWQAAFQATATVALNQTPTPTPIPTQTTPANMPIVIPAVVIVVIILGAWLVLSTRRAAHR